MEPWSEQGDLHLAEQGGARGDFGAELERGVLGYGWGEGCDEGAGSRGGEVGGGEELDAVFGWVRGGFELLLLEGALVAVVVEVGPAGVGLAGEIGGKRNRDAYPLGTLPVVV